MKKSKINWHNIDWTKRTTDIANELGVAPSVVSYHRNEMPKRRAIRGTYHIDWNGVDWAKPNFAIAAERNASPSAVIIARRKYAPEHLKVGRDIEGSHGKMHFRDHYTGKNDHATSTLSSEEHVRHLMAQRRAAVIFTADMIGNDQRLRTSYGIGDKQIQAATITPLVIIESPVQKPAQPSWLKRKLIALRDWLFNLCVSVEKEANK